MRKLIFLGLSTLFLSMACVPSYKIRYDTREISPSGETIPWKVNLRPLADLRAENQANYVHLNNNGREAKTDFGRICINAEKHYRKEKVGAQIGKMMAEHFTQAGVFRECHYGNGSGTDYYITAVLADFYGIQEYSAGAAAGSAFGLIGAIATSGLKKPVNIVIRLTDIRIYSNEGELIGEIGDFERIYDDELYIDGQCTAIYGHVNNKLKEFNTELGDRIVEALKGKY